MQPGTTRQRTSSFAFAAAPELDVAVTQEGTRTGGVHYVVKTATYLYSEASTYSTPVYPNKLPVGTHLVRVNSTVYNSVWYKIQYGSYVGYIPRGYLTEVQ